jgi:Pyruvate/2-oxoacid:ferredoxin oxidoreductase delta subunit
MWYGFEEIPKILKGLERYLEEQHLKSFDTIRGISLPFLTTPDNLQIQPGSARVDAERCNGCGSCLRPGHCTAIFLEEEKARVNPALCIGCSVCANLCPREAIRMEAF